jgi:DNA-directed RNA polymerase specialized sigma24 family protein
MNQRRCTGEGVQCLLHRIVSDNDEGRRCLSALIECFEPKIQSLARAAVSAFPALKDSYDDICQTLRTKLASTCHRWDPQRGHAVAFIDIVLIHQQKDILRQHRQRASRESNVEDADELERAIEPVDEDGELEAEEDILFIERMAPLVAKCLELLPPVLFIVAQRSKKWLGIEAVMRSDVPDMQGTELRKLLNCSNAQINVLRNRIKSHLRGCLEPHLI